MPNVKRIEGGGKGGLEPKQTYEKNLSFISNTNVISHFNQGLGLKKMQEKFTFIAPIVAADVKPWNDRNTNNADTKLSKEKPLSPRKPLPSKPLSPENKRKKNNR